MKPITAVTINWYDGLLIPMSSSDIVGVFFFLVAVLFVWLLIDYYEGGE